MRPALLLAALLIACASRDQKSHDLDKALEALSSPTEYGRMEGAGAIVRLCCAWQHENHEPELPAYRPACRSLNLLLVTSNERIVLEELLRRFWTAPCQDEIPAAALILALARSPDDQLRVRNEAVRRLVDYEPTPQIITALVGELRRPLRGAPGDPDVHGGISVLFSDLGEADLEQVIEGLTDPSPLVRHGILMALLMAGEHRLDVPHLDRVLSTTLESDEDESVASLARSVLMDRRETAREPVDEIVARLMTSAQADHEDAIRLLARRRVTCGNSTVTSQLAQIQHDATKPHRVRSIARHGLIHRHRHCPAEAGSGRR